MFAQAKGVTKDPAKAAEWYTKASEQGHVEAQYELGKFRGYLNIITQAIGVLYYEGVGVASDLAKALELFHMAAEEDFAQAQYHIGEYYYQRAQPPDYQKAMEWLLKASDASPNAQFSIGMYITTT